MNPPPGLQDLIETVRQDSPTDRALDQLVTAAATVAQLEDTSDALLGHFVDRCRREGRSWSEISGALGVSKQAVHKRFAASLADQIIASTPAPTFERFTSRARSALAAATRAAQSNGTAPVSSAHLLIGLFAEPDGVAAKALQAMHVDEQAVRAAVQAALADSDDAQPDPAQRFTPDAHKALRHALEVALELMHNYIGTEHLLLALYRNPGSAAAVILADLGTTEQQARSQVTMLLRGFRPPSA